MKATELLHAQSNAENTDNKNSGNEKETLIERTKFTDAPFTLIKQDEKYYVVMGDYRVSDVYETENQALHAFNATASEYDGDKYITSKTNWGVLTNVISVIVEETLNLRGGK